MVSPFHSGWAPWDRSLSRGLLAHDQASIPQV